MTTMEVTLRIQASLAPKWALNTYQYIEQKKKTTKQQKAKQKTQNKQTNKQTNKHLYMVMCVYVCILVGFINKSFTL